MAVQQNQAPNDPSLSDLLKLFRKNMLLGLNCHHVGTIQSFNATSQTANATVNYKKTFFRPNAAGVYRPVLEDYPQLIDCPVYVVGGGGGCLTFPIAQGDECLMAFNDRDLDNWFQGGGANAAVNSSRLHSFADAVIFVGLRSLANVIVSYSSSAIELRNREGTNKVSIASDTVTVQKGATTVVLNDSKISGALGSTMTFEFDATGKMKFTNATGEFIAALIQALSTATAGGFPLLADLTTLQSFQG